MPSGPGRVAPVGGARDALRPPVLPASIAPVGLEAVASDADPTEDGFDDQRKERVAQTGSIRIPLKRRQLRGIVFGAVAGCGLILVAAVIARVSQASNEPPPSKSSTAIAPGTAVAQPDHVSTAQPTSATRAATPPPLSIPAPTDVPATGTVRLERPAARGGVWIDGKKVTSTSALVECGTHQIRIGWRGRVRAMQVPCGGELVLSR